MAVTVRNIPTGKQRVLHLIIRSMSTGHIAARMGARFIKKCNLRKVTRYICVQFVNSCATCIKVILSTDPAIMSEPPNGVMGPKKLNLEENTSAIVTPSENADGALLVFLSSRKHVCSRNPPLLAIQYKTHYAPREHQSSHRNRRSGKSVHGKTWVHG